MTDLRRLGLLFRSAVGVGRKVEVTGVIGGGDCDGHLPQLHSLRRLAQREVFTHSVTVATK